jgi:hypothetical protein
MYWFRRLNKLFLLKRARSATKEMSEQETRETNERIFYYLVQSLQLVASDVEEQIKVPRAGLCIPDEICLCYCDFYNLSINLDDDFINEEQRILLNNINDHFTNMSNDKSLWTIEQMSIALDWAESRRLALKALDAFGIPKTTPDRSVLK